MLAACSFALKFLVSSSLRGKSDQALREGNGFRFLCGKIEGRPCGRPKAVEINNRKKRDSGRAAKTPHVVAKGPLRMGSSDQRAESVNRLRILLKHIGTKKMIYGSVGWSCGEFICLKRSKNKYVNSDLIYH